MDTPLTEPKKTSVLMVTEEQRQAFAEMLLLFENIKDVALKADDVNMIIQEYKRGPIIEELVNRAKKLKKIAREFYPQYKFEVYVQVETKSIHIDIVNKIDSVAKYMIIDKIYRELDGASETALITKIFV